MWQKTFEKYRQQGFTVVGLALDAEGIGPAKRYYERFGITFPALVDPNYATGFGAVPKTFFVNEHGVVQSLRGWEQRLKSPSDLAAVTPEIRKRWTRPNARLEPREVSRLLRLHRETPEDLPLAVDLGSRYLDLGLHSEARSVLKKAVSALEPKEVARAESNSNATTLGQAYLQLARAHAGNRKEQVRCATLSFYLNPSVGFGKQIARIIAPEKFDGRPRGDFDNQFREGTLRRLRRERDVWLRQD